LDDDFKTKLELAVSLMNGNISSLKDTLPADQQKLFELAEKA